MLVVVLEINMEPIVIYCCIIVIRCCVIVIYCFLNFFSFKELVFVTQFSQFLANVLILYPPETPGSQRFSGVSEGVNREHWPHTALQGVRSPLKKWVDPFLYWAAFDITLWYRTLYTLKNEILQSVLANTWFQVPYCSFPRLSLIWSSLNVLLLLISIWYLCFSDFSFSFSLLSFSLLSS